MKNGLMAPQARVLFIDAYDSFSNNIIALLETELDVEVVKIHIDSRFPSLPNYVSQFSAVVCGPGPGHPTNIAEVGLFRDIWALESCAIKPVLGICLGFQSLVVHCGGKVQQLSQGRHGIETRVTSSSKSIFSNLPWVHTVQYHSLHGSLGHRYTKGQESSRIWEPSESCPDLLPLAWELENEAERHGGFHRNMEPILMAVKHVEKPFYGIQFHPESVCSKDDARQVIVNWWDESSVWLQQHKPINCIYPGVEPHKTLFAWAYESSDDEIIDGFPERPDLQTPFEPLSSTSASPSPTPLPDLISTHMELGCLTVPRVCESLHLEMGEMVVLDSEKRIMPSLGVSSVIGIVEPSTLRMTYSIGTGFVVIQEDAQETRVSLDTEGGDIFAFLKAFMADRKIFQQDDRAFCGGLMGYITYEGCLETIGVPASCHANRPDVCFVFVERSIVIDHLKNTLHVQSLNKRDGLRETGWVMETAAMLSALAKLESTLLYCDLMVKSAVPSEAQCNQPAESQYRHKVSLCQEQIRAGNSYELCLSDQTTIHIRKDKGQYLSPWVRYLHLRERNPAPFAAYLRLGALTLLSTSPERFMSWSRFEYSPSLIKNEPPAVVSTCQFRPIKGTVSKQRATEDGRIEEVSKEEATRLLSVEKERAENLMIVDLIRHDLYNVVSPWDVEVKALMAVEEYETLYQLVSVIEGKLCRALRPMHSPTPTPHGRRCSNRTGIDVLAASLPPGSMTGAPKLRSCQILQDIEEHQPRSIYSGVLGYMCVSGKGDFSVVIRSVFKWDDSGDGGHDEECWRIGAGGAVTGLSTEEGEWAEMVAKLKSTLGGFVNPH